MSFIPTLKVNRLVKQPFPNIQLQAFLIGIFYLSKKILAVLNILHNWQHVLTICTLLVATRCVLLP